MTEFVRYDRLFFSSLCRMLSSAERTLLEEVLRLLLGRVEKFAWIR